MKTPNPFSFKILSPKRHKGFFGYVLAVGVIFLMGIIVLAFMRKENKQDTAKASVSQIAAGDVKNIKVRPPSQDLAYVETAIEDEAPTGKLSALAEIYKDQDKKNTPFFQMKPWQKYTAFCVHTQKKPLVAVVIKNAQALTKLERGYLLKAGIPLGLYFTGLGGSQVRKLKNMVKRVEFYCLKGIKQIPQTVGLIAQKGKVQEKGKHLIVPATKTKTYKYFTFPLIQEKRGFYQSSRSLIMLTPRKHRIRNFFDWVNAQKKRVTFVAPSQLATGYCRPKVMVDPNVINKAHLVPQ